jgi:hypothetical protein
MTDTTHATDPAGHAEPVEAPMGADDILVRLDAVILSLITPGRPVDLWALRSLPRWRAETMARLAHKAGAITKAQRDEIVREAAVLGRVKPAKASARR